MPCQDITEVLQLELDDADRVVAYSLHKRTCGAIVGQEALLLALFRDQPAERIAAWESGAMTQLYALHGDERDMLYYKHFFAVQDAVRVVLGHASGDPQSACRAVAIHSEPNGNLRFEADVSAAALVQKIRSCGACGGCGTINHALRLST